MIQIEDRSYIVSPSDFKLELSDIVDKDGNPLDLSSMIVLFRFMDRLSSNFYDAIYDPSGEHTKNLTYDPESGKITIIFENYKFTKGQLFSQIGVITPDQDFEDSSWNFYENITPINIVIK